MIIAPCSILGLLIALNSSVLPQRPDFGADSGFSTAFGGLMTGMLGVGIGEVVVPQLVKKNGVPLPVAAGTSVLVVFLNAVGEKWEGMTSVLYP